MLVAHNQKKQLINLLKGDQIEGPFFCPDCRAPLRLRHGKKVRRHFAHIALKDCQGIYASESQEHLGLKALLFTTLSRSEVVSVEERFPDIGQIADLLVNDSLVLEVQCSPLSSDRLKERTQAYHQQGLHVEWLLGEKLWVKRCLRPLHYHFLNFSPWLGFYLWEADLAKQELRLKYMIHEQLDGKVVYLEKGVPMRKGMINGLRLPFACRKNCSLSIPLMRNVAAYIQKQLSYGNSKWLKAQEQAYRQGHNLITASDDTFYPQVRLPKVVSPLSSNDAAIASYYACFEVYYGQRKPSYQLVVYSPILYWNYDKIRNK